MSDQRSADAQAGRWVYNTKAWNDLRWRVYAREAGACQRCRRLVGLTKRDWHADHIVKHGGDWGLAFDEANVQLLCHSCHNSGKQGDEKRGFSGACDASGWPTDAKHPVNAMGRGGSKL